MQAKDSGMGHFTLFLPRGIGAGAQGKPGVVVSQNGKTFLMPGRQKLSNFI